MPLKLYVIGCGSATPIGQRISSAFALKKENEFFLVDCSEGAQMQLKPYGIRMQKISRVFISHLHGDHYFGLIGLLSSLHLFGRTEPIHIYGHAVLKKIIDLQMKAGNTTLSYPLCFHTIKSHKHALIYEDDEIKVETFPLIHSIPTNGFVFREKSKNRNLKKDFIADYNPSVEWIQRLKAGENFVDGTGNHIENQMITTPSSYQPKSFAYCSDTVYTESILPYIQGVDLLYHEATFMDNMKDVARDKLHATASEAATIAKAANVKALLIGHYSARYASLEPLLQEARAIFPATIAAEEGLVLDV
ncbi:MAG: ribonuclease Z [Bacteroidales bacterium]|jgi:ribonuclease Z|nr:ribonuclease Z [Bacteroidales bacterium]MDD3331435.1 ribonuclease Z [Bacteroidales bacterium]MDD3691947.1 ribonuclease Z [Bacteroidales bacterium]MDD4045459.1 ribonuclease Z [Bacteroidales bacterium]MDD4582517.1 ribonuclease Z [Bacteroidales bacterium]